MCCEWFCNSRQNEVKRSKFKVRRDMIKNAEDCELVAASWICVCLCVFVPLAAIITDISSYPACQCLTHSALLYRISVMLSLKFELANHVVTFVHWSLMCGNSIVNFVIRHALYFRRMLSPIGRNFQYCSDLFRLSLYSLKVDKKQLPSFKRQLKTFLFTKSFPSV